MTDARHQIENIRDQLERGGRGGCAADREALLAFSDAMFLIPSQVGDLRHLKLLGHTVRIAEEVGGIAGSLDDRAAAEEIVRWIHTNYDNEETNSDYRIALKVFGRRVSDENGDDPPESLAWIPSTVSNTYDPTPNPSDMLGWETDVLPMIEQTGNLRDAALIAVAWDAGARSGELLSATVGSVTDHKHGFQLTVQGKTGQRSIVLIPSVPFLQRWLSVHPGGDREDPLWSKLSTSEKPTYQCLRNAVQKAAEAAGVEKPVTFTNFRKSCASHLASRGINQAHLEDHHGWVRGSKIASRYVAVFADDTDREVAEIHGLEIDEADEP